MCCRIFLTPASIPAPQLPLWTPQTFIVLASRICGTTLWQVSSNHMLLRILNYGPPFPQRNQLVSTYCPSPWTLQSTKFVGDVQYKRHTTWVDYAASQWTLDVSANPELLWEGKVVSQAHTQVWCVPSTLGVGNGRALPLLSSFSPQGSPYTGDKIKACWRLCNLCPERFMEGFLEFTGTKTSLVPLFAWNATHWALYPF